MNKKSSSASSLFLMEMIVTVFFFILCASTCILVFVSSNNRSRLASDTNRSVLKAESIAESFKGGRFDEFLSAEQGEKLEDGSFLIGWSEAWLPAAAEIDPVYQAAVSLRRDGQMETADILISRVRDQKELYRLQVKKYHMESE